MMRGRVAFDGFLAHDTAAEIAEAMGSVLNGKQYTFVSINEGFGWRPEVRVNCTLREPVKFGVQEVNGGDDFVWVRFSDWDYVTSIHAWARTQREARDLPLDSLDRTYVTVFEDGQIEIEHRAPAGYRLWWTLAVTGPAQSEEDIEEAVAYAKGGLAVSRRTVGRLVGLA